jgi:hypothetical protein
MAVPHKIRAGEVVKLIEKFDVGPRTVWPKRRKRGDGSKSFRGYRFDWFEDAIARYLPSEAEDEDE